MSEFEDRIVADLTRFAPQLVEPGLAQPGFDGVPRSVAGPLRQAEDLARLVPALLCEAFGGEDEERMLEVTSARPSHGRLSRRPADYQSAGTRVLPKRWVRRIPAPVHQPIALRWLWHLIDERARQLAPSVARRSKWIEEARRTRSGSSAWAELDLLSLDALGNRLQRTTRALDRARALVINALPRRTHPHTRAPHPFPRGPSWAILRRLLLTWSGAGSLEALRGLLHQPVHAADLAFLYQRWCGLWLLNSLREAGLAIMEGDPVGALLLGGTIHLRGEGAQVELWVEPRLTVAGPHHSGFRCAGKKQGEATPDYLLVTPGPRGPSAFVVDATKTSDEDVLRSKFRYLSEIESAATTTVAGVPTTLGPLRAWAAAPIGGNHCRLESSNGSQGVIPMQPAHFQQGGLRAWVQDVVDHSRAWGQVRERGD